MAEEEIEEEPPKKPSKVKPILIGLVLALLCGGGGFYVMYSGMLGGGGAEAYDTAKTGDHSPLNPVNIAFVALDPMIISLGAGGANRHLRFTAQLEVAPKSESKVEHLKPRVVDVLNGYLRAVDAADLENPTALIRLRAQMLRRVQVVAGHGLVRDLLITEFVLN